MAQLTLQEALERVEQGLRDLGLPPSPEGLYDPIRYVLAAHGKHIRPCLSLLASSLFTEDVGACTGTAIAMELFHNFTLVHDDIMDDAILRRGLPSVHEKWDLNTAILSGDVMLVLACRLLSEMPGRNATKAMHAFCDTAVQVCEGQRLDMDFEKLEVVRAEDYIHMITQKTSVLLGCSLYCGALAGGAEPELAGRLYDAGVNLGISFQIRDDYLDIFSDKEKTGKQKGGDILRNKKTYPWLRTLEKADEVDREAFLEASHSLEGEEKIAAILHFYKKYNVATDADEVMRSYYDPAVHLLETLPVPEERKRPLMLFAEEIYRRTT